MTTLCLLSVEVKEFLDILTAVGQTWYLVLTTKLALTLEPFVKESFLCNDNLQWLEGDVLVTLCLIIGIDSLK